MLRLHIPLRVPETFDRSPAIIQPSFVFCNTGSRRPNLIYPTQISSQKMPIPMIMSTGPPA